MAGDIQRIPPEKASAVARQLTIVNRYEKGRLTKWTPSVEQMAIFMAMFLGGMLFILKPRQIGSSTACRLYEFLVTAVNDAAGNRFYAAMFIDTDEKARKQFVETKELVSQLGFPCKINNSTYSFHFPNGSVLEYRTAGGNRAGASTTYHYLRITELPYFKPNPAEVFSGLMSTLIPGGQLVIETTLNHEEFSRGLWEADNDYRKLFFPFEAHAAYHKEPGKYLTEDWEAKLRKEGFTDRASMEYWLHLMVDKHGGDEVKTWREYPQKPEHSWRFAEGLWITVEPRLAAPLSQIEVRGKDKNWKIEEYRKPERDNQYIIGVDVAGGHGLDHSVVVVIDKKAKGAIAACFTSPDIKQDDLMEVISVAQQHYTVTAGIRDQHIPEVYIEVNGIGQTLYDKTCQVVSNCWEVKTSEATKYEGLLEAKRLIEQGICFGPKRLREEAASLHSNEKQKFEGKKDLCMALGFCYINLKQNPYQLPYQGRDPNTFFRR